VTDELLVAELRRDEGVVPHAYQDHLGYWTIGVGRLIDKRRGGGLSDDEIDYLLNNNIRRTQEALDANLPWWRELDPVRQRALINMCFQLGMGGLLKFTNSLAAIKAGKWETAASNLKQSLWAKQTPERAARVIAMFRTGTA
jgi:lysozyme